MALDMLSVKLFLGESRILDLGSTGNFYIFFAFVIYLVPINEVIL